MPADLKTRTIRGVGWSALQNWGMSLTSFLVYPILARMLGPENYGLIAMAGVFISVLEIFSDVSFGAAIEQRKDLEPGHLDAIFWAFLLIGVVLTVGSMIAAPAVARYFHEPELPAIIRWLSLGFLLTMISGVQTSLLRRDLRIKALAGRSLVATAVGSGAGISLAFLGGGVWSIVVQRLLTRVISVILLWKMSDWRPRCAFSWRHFQDVAGFGISVMAYRILQYIRLRLDQLLIGRYFGALELGLYFNAVKLMNLASGTLFGTYTQVSMPALAQLQDDRVRFRAGFNKVARFISVIAFPAFAVLSILAEDLTLVILGPQWQVSASVLSILALSGIPQSIQHVNGAGMMATGQMKSRLVLMVAGTVLCLTGFLIAYRFGIVAVAIAYTLSVCIMAPIEIFANRSFGIISVRGLLRSIWAPAAATLIMAVATVGLRECCLGGLSYLPRLLVSLAASGVVFLGCVVVLDRKIWSELVGIFKLLVVRGGKRRAP